MSLDPEVAIETKMACDFGDPVFCWLLNLVFRKSRLEEYFTGSVFGLCDGEVQLLYILLLRHGPLDHVRSNVGYCMSLLIVFVVGCDLFLACFFCTLGLNFPYNELMK